MTAKFYEKTLATERKYAGTIIGVYPVVLSAEEVEGGIRKGTIFDTKTLSAWLAYKLKSR